MDPSHAEDLYQRAIALDQEAFAAGLFSAAYHALMTALHLAEHIESNLPLQQVGALAAEQLAYIDSHFPEYVHSTRSSRRRNVSVSIFANISSQANIWLKIRSIKQH